MQRDLSSPDVWVDSLERSRARRERAAAQRQRVDLPAGPVTLAAAIALTGSTAAVASDSEGGFQLPAGMGAASNPPSTAVAQAPSPAAPATADPAPVATEVKRERPAAPVKVAPKPQPSVAKTSSSSTSSTTVAVAQKPQPVAAAASVKPNGVTGLQNALGVAADGDFGATTERVLKRWQRKHGLAPDGVAGPETRKALGLDEGPVLKRERRGPSNRRSGRKGGGKSAPARPARGGGVTALQRALGISADGVFGPGTERALKRWQRKHGLAADGVAGPQTRQALGLGPGPVLKRKRAGGGGGGSNGGGSGVVQRVIAAANAIATKPYEYGGGHGSFTDNGYDCSGSVSYALHGGGLLSTPLDSSAFMSYGKPGPGRRITIYANPGHVYMVIDGRRFDTSARSETGSRWTSTQRSSSGYTVRHPAGL